MLARRDAATASNDEVGLGIEVQASPSLGDKKIDIFSLFMPQPFMGGRILYFILHSSFLY
jgi:hypothetical protein